MGATGGVSEPHVAILTVTTNASAHLRRYFDALAEVSYPNWSLTVVDNASTDGSPELAEERCPQATIVRNEHNLGFTGACNGALASLREDPRVDFVLFLNDDTEVAPGFLEPLVARAGRRTLAAPKTYLSGSAGPHPPVVLDDSAGEFDWWRGKWKGPHPGSRPANENVAAKIGNANFSCLLVSRGVLNDVGLLDDAFFVYYDDTDFCRRATMAGYGIVYEPASVVFHKKGATLGGQLTPFGCYYLSRNRPFLMRKHLSRPRFIVFLGYFLATRTARMAMWMAQGRRDLVRASVAGMRDFALGRMGPGRPPPGPGRS